MKSTLSESIHKCFQLISNGNSLSSLTSKSEELRKDYAEQLRKANVDKEALSNTLSKIRQAKQLNEVKFEIVEEQLKFLYDSMQNLFGNKNKNDSKEFEEIVENKKLTEVT
jgi:predicted  nucleic acid-binding Zn-ribbon protein